MEFQCPVSEGPKILDLVRGGGPGCVASQALLSSLQKVFRPAIAPRGWREPQRCAAQAEKLCPADRATQLLEAIIEPDDRVAIEGDNQKQADFLASALANVDPGRSWHSDARVMRITARQPPVPLFIGLREHATEGVDNVVYRIEG